MATHQHRLLGTLVALGMMPVCMCMATPNPVVADSNALFAPTSSTAESPATSAAAAREFIAAVRYQAWISRLCDILNSKLAAEVQTLARRENMSGEKMRIFEEFAGRLTAAIRSELNWERLDPIIVREFRSFSPEDTAAATAFYRTPVGRSIAAKATRGFPFYSIEKIKSWEALKQSDGLEALHAQVVLDLDSPLTAQEADSLFAFARSDAGRHLAVEWPRVSQLFQKELTARNRLLMARLVPLKSEFEARYAALDAGKP